MCATAMICGISIEPALQLWYLHAFIGTGSSIRALVKTTPYPLNDQLQSIVPIDIVAPSRRLLRLLFVIGLISSGIELGCSVRPSRDIPTRPSPAFLDLQRNKLMSLNAALKSFLTYLGLLVRRQYHHPIGSLAQFK